MMAAMILVINIMYNNGHEEMIYAWQHTTTNDKLLLLFHH